MSNNIMDAHHQWATRPQDQRFQTLEALREAVHRRRLVSRATDLDCGKIRVTVDTETSGLLVNGNIQPSEPSHWSFGQLATLVKAPASYLRTLNPERTADLLNYGLDNSGRETVKFMTVAQDEGPATLQAVTSQTYGRIWDADVVDSVARIVERSGGKFHNPLAYAHRGNAANGFQTIDTSRQVPSGLYASDRDCFIFMIDGGSYLEAGPRAQLNRGFICWNSETGSKTFGLTTFLFNGVCGNHIIWGASEVNRLIIRHTQGGPQRFDNEATGALLSYVNSSAGPELETIKRAQALQIGDKPETVTEYLLKNGKFSKAEVRSAIEFAKAEEGECRTLWHAVQGFTAYARGIEYADARVDLETRAGKLLNLASN